jgi:methyl-accepting chemotaxis protein
MIAALMRSAHVSSESVIKLENLMNDITEKADIITNISDSVNLLSLNAAIEAARAGEHGRGFAVVSNEIGKLSEMTQASVKVIRSTIDNVKVNMSMIDSNNKTLMNDLSGSVDKITQFGKIVQDSIGLSRDDMKKQAEVKSNSIEVKAGSENLASAMSEQSIVTEEITKAVSDINGSIQSYAAGAEELSASSSSLAKIAENLVAKVSIFKV